MANGPHYVDCAFNFNNQAQAFIFPADQCVQIDYVQNIIVVERKGIIDYFPSLKTTVFATGIKAAFTNSKENEVHIFKDTTYALLNFANKKIIYGPQEITERFPLLKSTSFENGIDAAFASSRPNEAYIFKGDQYAIINFTTDIKKDFWVTSPQQIIVGFRYFIGTAFEVGLDAAFPSYEKNKAYIFKGNTYAVINYAPETIAFIFGPMNPISDGITCLKDIIPYYPPSY